MSLTVSFKNSFLPYAIKEWNKLVPEIRNAETYASFRIIFLNFKIRTGNTTYKIYDLLGIKLLPRLRLDIHRHNFADSLIPLCSCSLETECTLHFFSICQNYTTLRRALVTDLKNIYDTIMSFWMKLTYFLLYCKETRILASILTATIKFIKVSERFDQPLF